MPLKACRLAQLSRNWTSVHPSSPLRISTLPLREYIPSPLPKDQEATNFPPFLPLLSASCLLSQERKYSSVLHSWEPQNLSSKKNSGCGLPHLPRKELEEATSGRSNRVELLCWRVQEPLLSFTVSPSPRSAIWREGQTHTFSPAPSYKLCRTIHL